VQPPERGAARTRSRLNAELPGLAVDAKPYPQYYFKNIQFLIVCFFKLVFCRTDSKSPSSKKVSISTDIDGAGHYLCDFVFYKSLHCSQGKSLFIHVPPLDKPYTKEELASTMIHILELVIKQI
jgi:hypothetical protein